MPLQPPNDAVRIFLSYAREDYDAVSALYDRLEELGLRPWMDKIDILPGKRWETKLEQAIHEAHYFLAFLSAKSVAKRGYLQREFKQALDLWQEKLEEDIYLIPVRLDECEMPETLRAFQWANLYEEDAWCGRCCVRSGLAPKGGVWWCRKGCGISRRETGPLHEPLRLHPLPMSPLSRRSLGRWLHR